MLSSNIKIGDRLEINLKKSGGGGKTYISQVENVIDKTIFIVHVPISYGEIIKLPTGDRYSILFFTEKGMLKFDASIMDYMKEDGFNLMKIKLGSEGEKMQRREFFRFSCLLPIKFSVISDSVDTTQEQAPPAATIDGIIKDVGGGGVRFVSNDPIDEGSKIKCLIFLNEDYYLVIGKVLHRQHFPKSSYKYQYRAVFIGILPEEQERIVQFIFQEQRKHLQKS